LNKLYRATMGSFRKQLFPTRRNVYFISEPEACALFTVQQLIDNKENNLIPVRILLSFSGTTFRANRDTSANVYQGECFVICDAGGGTVDLVTYRIQNIDPLEISRVGAAIGTVVVPSMFHIRSND
jgi:hypothetical protein